MKALMTSLALMGVIGFAGGARADESLPEKAKAAGNDAARAVKKTMHRAEEAVCTQGDVKCLEQKAKHRLEEAKDYTKDKAAEIKNDVDSDDSSE